MNEFDTYPKLIKAQYEKYANTGKLIMRQKKFGIWQNITWDQYYDDLKYFSLGLASLGFQRGDNLLILGNNAPEWLLATYSAFCLGGVAVSGAYVDSSPTEIEWVVNNSDSTFLVVEDQEQIDKILSVKDKIGRVKKAIYWDNKGLRSYDDDLIMFFPAVVELGREFEKTHPGYFEENIEMGKKDDISQIIYTSGTTGNPKGTCIYNGVVMERLEEMSCVLPCESKDELFTYIPFAWPTDSLLTAYKMLKHGNVMNFPEEPESIEDDLREISPHFLYVVPRQLEQRVRTIQSKMMDSTWLKQVAYKYLLPVGYNQVKLGDRSPGLFQRIAYFFAFWFLFRPLKDKLGYRNIRYMLAGGAQVSPDIMNFIRALGIDIRNGYGTIEIGSIVVGQCKDQRRTDGCGSPLPGITVRIAGDGEVIVKSEKIFGGYYKNPEASDSYLQKDGYCHLGDAGFFGDDDELVIIDRVVDLMKMKDGTVFSPMFMENKLKFSPYLSDAIIFGDGQDYISVAVAVDYITTGRWAESKHVAYTTYRDLSEKSEVYDLVLGEIKKVNEGVLEHSRIKKFVLLHKELDADDAELTRSRKLRRGFVAKKYHDMIEAIYGDKKEYAAEFEATYQDGSKKVVKANMKIASVEGN